MDEFGPTMIQVHVTTDEEVYGSCPNAADHKYHIHVTSYPTGSGNAWCTHTGGHYHPQVGVPCPLGLCEVGDLSNKHGKLNFGCTAISVQFTDLYRAL